MGTLDLNSGAAAAVLNEVDLLVIGAIPEDLNGIPIRNGPNPLRGRFKGNDVLDWWPEDAMLHGISLHGGHATHYRNRWARTKRWADVYQPDTSLTLLDTNPNVNVLCHAGEIRGVIGCHNVGATTIRPGWGSFRARAASCVGLK